MGRTLIETVRALRLDRETAKILIVGPWGGRDYHWLTGFGYHPDTLDLGHHPWGPTTFVGDACAPETWAKVSGGYDVLVICDVIEHLPRDFDALVYARAVLKPEGHLLLSVPFRHNSEPTHVRSYTDVTLRRLLGLAGFEVRWAKQRPGLLEAWARAAQIFNYGVALAMPSARVGARVLAWLLSLEFKVNNGTSSFYKAFGRSPQKGMIYLCRLADAVDYIALQKNVFIARLGCQEGEP